MGWSILSRIVLLGVVGLEDPPREGVREALDRCRLAGVSVLMHYEGHRFVHGISWQDQRERNRLSARGLGKARNN